MLRFLGVIGYPLARSLSPAIQQAALDHARLDIEYQAWPTPPNGLQTRVSGLRGESVLGANVTIPHKEAVLPMMDEVDAIAARAGAVNTIVNRERRLHGYNTDVAGFLRALLEDARFEPAGRRVVIAGAGGAARAVVVALLEAEAGAITVINRTLSRAHRLVDDLRPFARVSELRALPQMYASWAAVMGSCDLLVNCTSAGAADFEEKSPVPADLIRSSMLVYDLVYHPAETALMAAARERGAQVIGGLAMLVYQGAASFELWTEQVAPVEVMFEAAREALGAGVAKGR
jgi:shikimate dehydrogenase